VHRSEYLTPWIRFYWEICSSTAGQELPRILGNPKVNYRFQNTSPFAPISSQTNLVRTLPNYFLIFSIAYIISKDLSKSGDLSAFSNMTFLDIFLPRGIIGPLSAVYDCLLNTLAATIHIWRSCATDSPCRGDRDPLII
jgi:hypothetical protein